MTRLLCAGDLHLGAGPDLGREPGDRLLEQLAVWNRIIDLAIEEDVDVLLFAGDAFERRRPTPAEVLAFKRPLARLRQDLPSCDVLTIVGNHDVAAFDRPTGLELLDDIDVHREPALWPGKVWVATLPWTPVSHLVAEHGGGDRDRLNERAAEILLEVARGLRAQIPSGVPAVLLLHWSVSGSALPNGLPVEQLREPVLELGELEAMGWDAIVAGHIHKAQRLGGDPACWPTAVYVGSPMPLNFGEANSDVAERLGVSEHGVWILELPGGARFIPIESRRLVTVDCDLTSSRAEPQADVDAVAADSSPSVSEAAVVGAAEPPSALDETDLLAAAISEHLPLTDAVVKVRYRATAAQARRLDLRAIRGFLDEAGVHKTFAIQAEIVREERARVAGLDEQVDEAQALDLWIASQGINGSKVERLRELGIRYLGEVRA